MRQGDTYLHALVSYPLPIVNGKYPLGSMFLETPDLAELRGVIHDSSGPRPIFTLKTYDYEIPESSPFYRKGECNNLRSLHQLFVEAEDPSEYQFALDTLGSYEHWESLCECTFFEKHLKRMRKTLEVRLDAKTVQAAKKAMSDSSGTQALQAAKWLNARVVRTGPKRGRPSNDEIEAKLKQEAAERAEMEQDMARLG